jgi:hypothetical protein
MERQETMRSYTVQQARSRLDDILDAVEAGKEYG